MSDLFSTYPAVPGLLREEQQITQQTKVSGNGGSQMQQQTRESGNGGPQMQHTFLLQVLVPALDAYLPFLELREEH